MRLSEFLAQPDVIRAGIQVVGSCKTSQQKYKVLARAGQSVMPWPDVFYLILDEPNPELDEIEVMCIRRKFGLGRNTFNLP